MVMLRNLNREVYSNYGPTADTGGLTANGAVVVYAYPDLEAIVPGSSKDRPSARRFKAVSERPEAS